MKLTLVDKKPEVANVASFIFEPETPLTWQAGQFMRYHVDDQGSDERGEDRFFTIATSPHEQNIMLTTRFVPDNGSTFKKDLQKLQIGDSVEAEGPSGEFVITDTDKDYIFIAGGIGITPFRSILKDLDHHLKPINVTLLYANRDQSIVYKDELEALLPNHPNLKIHYFIDPQRIDQAAIKQAVPDLTKPFFYASGPKPMVQVMEKLLAEMAIPEQHIKRDYFPGYESI